MGFALSKRPHFDSVYLLGGPFALLLIVDVIFALKRCTFTFNKISGKTANKSCNSEKVAKFLQLFAAPQFKCLKNQLD